MSAVENRKKDIVKQLILADADFESLKENPMVQEALSELRAKIV